MLLAMKGYEIKKCDTLRTEEEITARIETLRSTEMTPVSGLRQPKIEKLCKKQIAKT
jgi:hypothetical protein